VIAGEILSLAAVFAIVVVVVYNVGRLIGKVTDNVMNKKGPKDD
jgi:hypothetical protein